MTKFPCGTRLPHPDVVPQGSSCLASELEYNVHKYYMGKAHKNCIIGKILCLRHIIGTTFITRMTLYVYIVEGFKTSQNIYTFI